MALFRTKFERINFCFDPAVRQTADVVFEIDHEEYKEDFYHDFMTAAGEACRKQNPHWKDPHFHIDGYGGWSSVVGGYKFEKIVDVDLDFDLGEPGDSPIPRIAETFITEARPGRHGDTNSYRVTGFYKTYVYVRKEPETEAEKLWDEMIDEVLAEEEAGLTAEQRKHRASHMKVVSCRREEAEFVSGSGICGCIRRIEDITVTGRVNWNDRTIARARRDYNRRIDREERETAWPTEIRKYWEHEA